MATFRASRRTRAANSLIPGSFAAALTMLFVAVPAGASSYYVRATVLDARPVTSTRVIEHPVRQCTTVSSYRREDRYDHYDRHEPAIIPGIFGGLIGGLVGNQFGGGNGKTALTVVGAIAGSSIAKQAARENRRQRRYSEPVESCTTSYEREVIETVSGYDVTYVYAGQRFTKRVPEDPGDEIRVRVSVSPEI